MAALDVCRVIGLNRPVEPADFGRALEVRYLHEFDTEPYRSKGWLHRVADLRTKALRRVTAPYWLSMDADIRLSTDALLEALEWLQERPEWAGVGFWTNRNATRPEKPKGVAMACALFRSEATEGLEFRATAGWCECVCMSLDLQARGYTLGYHPTLSALHLTGD